MTTLLRLHVAQWRQIHLWLALVLGAPIAVASAAGLPITYWELTDSWADPAFYRETRVQRNSPWLIRPGSTPKRPNHAALSCAPIACVPT